MGNLHGLNSSRLARALWIEILIEYNISSIPWESRLARALWIEIPCFPSDKTVTWSRLARALWIEIA